MNDHLEELLAVTHKQALEFFVLGLSDVCDGPVDRGELLYNASVLAHHAQVSTQHESGHPSPRSLTEVFDHFVLSYETTRYDAGVMETAGAQCLLLTGFFEGQMRARHNVLWYASLGREYYNRAAKLHRESRNARLLASVAKHFEPWRRCHARLASELRDTPFLLRLRDSPQV